MTWRQASVTGGPAPEAAACTGVRREKPGLASQPQLAVGLAPGGRLRAASASPVKWLSDASFPGPL